MATTLEKISGFLNNKGLKHDVEPERSCIVTGLGTETYRDTEGRPGILIIISLDENGEYIRFMAPKCYQYTGPNKAALFEACLMCSYETKLVQFEYDPKDGEVRAVIEFPLEDAELTERQVMRCLSGMAQIVEEYHPTIQGAIDTGKVVHESQEEIAQAFQEFMRQRRQQRSKAAGGDLQLED